MDVVMAIDLSRVTFRRIRYNFLWATAYNVLMIPIAMGALVPIGFIVRRMTRARMRGLRRGGGRGNKGGVGGGYA